MEFLPLVGIVLLFWLFIIRPQSRRQKEVRSMQSALGVGSDVILTSGIYGTVAAIEDDRVQLTIADGVTITVARAAVGAIQPTEEPAVDDDPADHPADDQEPTGIADGSEEN